MARIAKQHRSFNQVDLDICRLIACGGIASVDDSKALVMRVIQSITVGDVLVADEYDRAKHLIESVKRMIARRTLSH